MAGRADSGTDEVLEEEDGVVVQHETLVAKNVGDFGEEPCSHE